MSEQSSSGRTIRVVDATPISPHSQALYETGKTILSESLETGRDFCKSMIGMSTGAIPVYLGILTFILPKKYILSTAAGWLIVLPTLGFIAASLLFVIGFLPSNRQISLDDPDDIEGERDRIIGHRYIFIWIGSASFFLSTAGAAWAIITNIGIQ